MLEDIRPAGLNNATDTQPMLSHIALIGPEERTLLWEQRVLSLIKPDKITLTDNVRALPADVEWCVYLPEKAEPVGDLHFLVKQGVHILVLGHPADYLEESVLLWKSAEETGKEIWFPLWNLFQPGLLSLAERLQNPHHILFIRHLSTDVFDFELRLKYVLVEELLLALTLLNDTFKSLILQKSSKSILIHVETIAQKPGSIRLSWDKNMDEIKRYISMDYEGYYSKTIQNEKSTITKDGIVTELPYNELLPAADLLFLSYVRAVRGLSHRPAFKLYDLFQHRSILRYI